MRLLLAGDRVVTEIPGSADPRRYVVVNAVGVAMGAQDMGTVRSIVALVAGHCGSTFDARVAGLASDRREAGLALPPTAIGDAAHDVRAALDGPGPVDGAAFGRAALVLSLMAADAGVDLALESEFELARARGALPSTDASHSTRDAPARDPDDIPADDRGTGASIDP